MCGLKGVSLPKAKRRPVKGAADLCWQAWDRLKSYSEAEAVSTIPPMIALHIGAAHLAALAAEQSRAFSGDVT